MVIIRGSFLLLFLLMFSSTTAINTASNRLSPVHTCLQQAQDIPNNRLNGRTLAGIIGFGWDDLRSVRTKPVFFETFDECRAEPTGHYLLPDNIVAIPILQTKIDEMANLYESFEYYKEDVSKVFTASASAGFSWLSASASFSKISQKTKENFAKYKSSLLQSKLNYEAFTLSQDSVGSLAPGFKGKIDEIADAIERGLSYRARYLSEVIVKEYGTHYISSADIGATVEQKTFIESKSTFNGATSLQGIQFAATVGLKKLFNGTLSASVSNTHTVTTQEIQALSNISKISYLETNGGPDINLIMAGNASFTIDNIVPYSFDGDWLYNIISRENFPDHSFDTLFNIQILLKNATETYYEKNTIQGCMDMNSPNFDFQANYDNGSCISNNDSYPFGGFYQTCTSISGPDSRCNGIQQSNEFVGGMKCNEALFEAVKLFDTIYEFPTRKENHPRRSCKGIWPFRKCRDVDVIIDYIDKVKVEAFWCRKKENVVIPAESGAMFGGVYENMEVNAITGKTGCPGSFKAYRMGRSTTICLSYQYEQDHKFSIPFAGFFSCQSAMAGGSTGGGRRNDGFRNGGNGNGGFRNTSTDTSRTRSGAGGTRGFRSPASNSRGGGFRNNVNVPNGENTRSNNTRLNGFINTNPEAPSRCPEGYSQQLLPIEMTCLVFYCIKKNTISNIFKHPQLLRPPYTLPQIAANNFSESTIHATYDGIQVLATPLNEITIPPSISDKFGGQTLGRIVNGGDGGGDGGNGTDANLANMVIDAFIQQLEDKIENLSNNLTATPTEMAQRLKSNNVDDGQQKMNFPKRVCKGVWPFRKCRDIDIIMDDDTDNVTVKPERICTGVWPFRKCRNIDVIIDDDTDKVTVEPK